MQEKTQAICVKALPRIRREAYKKAIQTRQGRLDLDKARHKIRRKRIIGQDKAIPKKVNQDTTKHPVERSCKNEKKTDKTRKSKGKTREKKRREETRREKKRREDKTRHDKDKTRLDDKPLLFFSVDSSLRER
jgi:hypothetical protein